MYNRRGRTQRSLLLVGALVFGVGGLFQYIGNRRSFAELILIGGVMMILGIAVALNGGKHLEIHKAPKNE